MDGHKQAKAYGEVWRGLRLWNQYCSHQIIHLRASQTIEPTNPPISTPGLVTRILGDTALLESLVGSMA